MKLKFFKNANKIFAKVGTSNVPVLMKLVDSYCSSALLYNLEVVDLNKNAINSLNFAFHRMFMKIFKTSSLQVVLLSLFNFDLLPIDLKLMMRKMKHLEKLSKLGNDLVFALRDIILKEKENLISHWCTLCVGVQYPCVKDAWVIFAERLEI